MIALLFAACTTVDTEADTSTDDIDTDTDMDMDTDAGPTPVHAFGQGPGVTGLLEPPAAIGAESVVCWFLSPVGGELTLNAVGMDSHTVVEYDRYAGVGSSFHTAGFAYDGVNEIVFPAYDNDVAWYSIDLDSGTLSGGSTPTMATNATWDVEYLVTHPSGWSWYPTAEDILAGSSFGAAIDLGTVSRGASWNGVVYGMWHSTSTLEVGGALPAMSVTLSNFDTWVWGIGLGGGKVHVIDSGGRFPNDGIIRIGSFDATGANTDNVELPDHPHASGLLPGPLKVGPRTRAGMMRCCANGGMSRRSSGLRRAIGGGGSAG